MPAKKQTQANASEKDSSKATTIPGKVKAKKERTPQAQNVESEKDQQISALRFRVEYLEKNMDPKVLQNPTGTYSIGEENFIEILQGALKTAEKELIKLRQGEMSSGYGDVRSNTVKLMGLNEKIDKLQKEISNKDTEIATIKTELNKANSSLDEMTKQLSDNSDAKSYAQLKEAIQKKDEIIEQLTEKLQSISQNTDGNTFAKLAALEASIQSKDYEMKISKEKITKLESTAIRQPTDDNTSAKLAALEASMQSKESEIKVMKDKIAQLESEAMSYKQSNAKLQEDMRKKDQASIEQLNKELQSIRKELEEKGSEIQRVKEDNKSQLQRMREVNEDALKRLNEQKDNEERSKQKWMDKVKELEKNTERSKYAKARSEALQTLLEEKEAEIQNITGEIESLKREMAGLKKSTDESRRLMEKIDTLEKEISKRDIAIARIKTELDKANSALDEMRKQLSDNRRKKDESIDQLNKELKSIRPDIQDLSDSNRPSKLAERFSKLYDDEWTNCYDTARTQFSTEQSAVQMLLRTCVKIYNSCTFIASKDVYDLQRAFSTFSEAQDDVLLIQIKQRRKRTRQVDIDLKRITPGIGDSVADMFGPDLIKSQYVRAFWVKCLEICWLMVIQEPPVYMDTETNKPGQIFDHAAYRPYTQTGNEFDYIVWPALYTHQGGDIMYKGVAQGRVTSDSVGGKRRSSLVKK